MKIARLIATLFTVIATLSIPVFAQTLTAPENASPSTQPDFEIIKENVKKRLQEVVQDKVLGDLTKEKVAIIGSLKSRTGNTFTIETDNTVKLASISSQTQVIRIPSSGSVSLEDISLEDNIVALGYEGPDEVLDTRRIIIQKTIPEDSKYQIAYGIITQYSTKEFSLTITNPADQSNKTFIVSRKAIIKQAYADDTTIQIARTKPLPVDAHALVVFLPAEDKEVDPVAYHVLLKTDPPQNVPDENDE
jgi:hypothetical protein